jgi:phage major head subunit gpT-like protein
MTTSQNTVITTGSIPRLLQEGIKKVFGDNLKQWDPKYSKIYEVMSSRKAYELFVQLEGFGLAAEKDQGDDITFDSRMQGFSPKFIHTTWAKGYIVTEEALDDELYGQLDKGARALSRAMNVTREVEAHAPLNDGWDTAVTMAGGDGKPLFSTTHSNGPSGGTYSNRLGVEADLSEASMEDALAIVSTMEDARGLPAMLTAKRLVIAAGVNEFNAQRIMGSVLQNDTANNATNAMRDMNRIKQGWMSTPYLTQAQAWFITTDSAEGLIYFQRKDVTFGQDNAFTSGNARFKASMRQSQGWVDARGAIGGSSGV